MTEIECDGVYAALSNSDSCREIRMKLAVDFISSLPDEILLHIISFTPTKFAIRTSVLSKRWKHLWYETTSISIDCNRVHLPSSINKTLSSYSSPKITSFELSISSYVTASQIDHWIGFAMSRKAENLSLVFKDYYRFPDFFYISSSVKQLNLTLARCNLFSPVHRYDMIAGCTVSWSSLRELSLSNCNIPDKYMVNILSGCPVLESLILNVCEKLRHLDLSKSPNLRRLEIHQWFQGPETIVAPHIRYLRLTNGYEPSTLVDVSSLTEAYFDLGNFACRRTLEADYIPDTVVKMLAKLRNIEKLTVGAAVLQILSLAELGGVHFPEFNIKTLNVKTTIDRSVIPGISRLLQNSHRLKKITVYAMKGNTIAGNLEEYLKRQGLNPKYGVFPTVDQTSSMLDGIIAKDAKSKLVASFIKLVMENTKTLESMVLRLGDYLDATGFEELRQMVPAISDNNVAIVIKQRP